MKKNYWWLVLCGVLPILVSLVTLPWADVPTGDDFSYAFIARELARTGTLHYNGWSAAMVGVQAYWGAAFIKCFGMSYYVLRTANLIMAAATGLLGYLVARRARLKPGLAAFASLSCLLSSLGVIVTPSFLTDITGLFFFLLTLYCFFRASDSAESTVAPFWHALLWRVGGATVALVGGTVRQILWVLPLLLLIYHAIQYRSDRKGAERCILLMLVTFFVAVALSSWYIAQPFSLPDFHWNGIPWLQKLLVPILLYVGMRILYTLGLFLLPLFVAVCLSWKVCRSAWRNAVLALSAVGALLATFYIRTTENTLWPYLGNNVTPCGLECDGIFTQQSEMLPQSIRWVLLWGVVFSFFLLGSNAVFCGVSWWQKRKDSPKPDDIRTQESGEPDKKNSRIVQCYIAALGYLGFTFVRLYVAIDRTYWDRYLLPTLFIFAVIALWYYQNTEESRVRWIAWSVLGLHTIYGVVTLHDHFSSDQAMLTATNSLLSRGVPRNTIIAGMEYDGWTQLLEAGAIWDARLKVADKAQLPAPRYDAVSRFYWFRPQLPNISPQYLVMARRVSGTTLATPLSQVSYRAWSPPFYRRLWIQKIAVSHSK